MSTHEERKVRLKKLLKVLKKLYPEPKSELTYTTPFQFLVAVMMSAQCTDKKVNEVTDVLFKTYKTPRDFAKLKPEVLAKKISSVTFYRNKAKAIVGAAKIIEENFNSNIPQTVDELVTLPGVAYKTANVVLGELYDVWEGIATDTHVRRFALRFDLTQQTELTKISKDLEALVPKKEWRYVNNGFVLYGRYVCPARPHDCLEHPLTAVWPQANAIWPKAK